MEGGREGGRRKEGREEGRQGGVGRREGGREREREREGRDSEGLTEGAWVGERDGECIHVTGERKRKEEGERYWEGKRERRGEREILGFSLSRACVGLIALARFADRANRRAESH